MASDNQVHCNEDRVKAELLQRIEELESRILANAPSDSWAIGGGDDADLHRNGRPKLRDDQGRG